MTIVYKLCSDGSFVAGDTETRKTAYAYPTSPYAEHAKRKPDEVAQSLLSCESWRQPCGPKFMREYDANNWEVLDGRSLLAARSWVEGHAK